jgi:PAS domain S-box-containing protein
MPELMAPEALDIVRSLDSELPFVLVSGSVGDEAAVAMLKAGADDYVLKENLARLPLVVEREMREATLKRARTKAERELRNSEERLRLAAGAANLGVWSYDVRTNRVEWNEQCYISCGVPAGTTITGDFLESLIHPEDRLARREILHQSMTTGEEAKMEYRVIRPDGGLRWISSYGRPLKDEEGAVRQVIGIATDITDRKLAELALRVSESRFRGLSASSPVGIFEADLNANFTYANARALEIWGMTEQQIVGRGWLAGLHTEDRGPLVNGWTSASEAGYPFEAEFRLDLPQTGIRWIHGRSVVLRDSIGTAVGTIGTLDDITERRRAEDSIRRNEKLAAVGQLASTIAHEINNPLEAITNLLYIAQTSEELAPSLKPLLDDAQSELHRVAQIATQTLQFHRRNAERSAISVAGIVDSAFSLFARQMKERGVEVVRDYSDVPDVVCYPTEIRQIFVNLIGNALDAMAAKKGRLRVRILEGSGASLGQRHVQISVADNGIGMDPAVAAHVFDAFFTTKGENGSGLGLWVTCEVLKRHGGSIRVRSRRSPDPSGTVITIKLPLSGEPARSFMPNPALKPY